jgi:asparagine synthase (glutamine-hydrolysing)
MHGRMAAGAWLVSTDPAAETVMRHILGKQAHIQAADGCALGVRTGCDAGGISLGEDGRAGVSVGTGVDARSTARWDPEVRSLTVETDPFGLYGASYTRYRGNWWAASDPRLLQYLPNISRRLDTSAVHGYLCLSHVPAPLTVFSEVFAVPAGQTVRFTGNGKEIIEPERWREAEDFATDEAMAVGEIRSLLRASVCRRTDGEQEVGVFISGGLDSSLVAALLKEAGIGVRLFTLDFGPPFDNELPIARRVAEHLKLPLHVVPARPAQVAAALEATASALHQPFGDGVVVPLCLLGQAGRDYVGTVFNGEGGDQIFGGWANKPMIAAELYGDAGYDREEAYLATYHRFLGQTGSLYTSAANELTKGVDPRGWISAQLNQPGYRSLLHRLRNANLRLKGAQNIAPRAAQLASAHGLRMHSPFFDQALAERTFSFPPEWFLQGSCEKYLLKRVAECYLPAEVVWREKRGMGVPVTDWCIGPLNKHIRRLLSPKKLTRVGWFQPEAVAALFRGEDGGEFRRRRLGEKLWTLLMLTVWLDAQPNTLAFPHPERAV